jgi:hypothetical protein
VQMDKYIALSDIWQKLFPNCVRWICMTLSDISRFLLPHPTSYGTPFETPDMYFNWIRDQTVW